jgi:hypothetical protein
MTQIKRIYTDKLNLHNLPDLRETKKNQCKPVQSVSSVAQKNTIKNNQK